MADRAKATCKTCPFYDAPPADEAVRKKRISVGGPLVGDCKLKPTIVKKAEDDWCGQHPDRQP